VGVGVCVCMCVCVCVCVEFSHRKLRCLSLRQMIFTIRLRNVHTFTYKCLLLPDK